MKGQKLWTWLQQIELLESKKWWDKSLDGRCSDAFASSADGTDFKLWEMKHNEFPIDSKACSQKFKHCAIKCMIAMLVFCPKCVFIAGPHKDGVSDLDMHCSSALVAKMAKNEKLCIINRGFRSKKACK